MGDHEAALRVLALYLGDIRAAEAYCEQHTGQAGYLALLSMLLAPGEGRAPLYTEACQLLAAQGTCCASTVHQHSTAHDEPCPVAGQCRRAATAALELTAPLHVTLSFSVLSYDSSKVCSDL